MTSQKQDWPSDIAFQGAASMLVCEVAAIRAVARVESGPQGAFLDSGEPVILFEPHLFHKWTGGRFSSDHGAFRVPQAKGQKWGKISYPRFRLGWYGPVSVQHDRLAFASAMCKIHDLPRDYALMSASWGLFQILGENFRQAGFDKLQRFINSMYRSVDDHLWSFVRFIRADSRLVDSIRAKNWARFARIYNGPKYKENGYDVKLESWYKKESAICTSKIWHGPGHQSSTYCTLTGLHSVHEANYAVGGGADQLARWKGEESFSGQMDEPPSLE